MTRLLALALAIGLTACNSIPPPGPRSDGPAQPDPATGAAQLDPASEAGSFALLTEVYSQSGRILNQRLRDRLANGASLHPVLDDQDRGAIAGTSRPFTYFAVPPEANVAACYPNSTDPNAAMTLAQLGVTPQSSAWRLGMPEFDQAGGCWAQNRPNIAGMSDEQAYQTWSRFYLDAKALRPYLEQSAQQRGYKWMSVCVYAFCPQYAYDLGSDAVLLERNIDEVSGMSPGLAMVRGAARQHQNRQWGFDFSAYRYWNGGPTVFDAAGRLVTGWSPSMLERNMYAAYMAGADVILNEAANLYATAAPHNLNPLGVVVSNFADFSLRRHPARGAPDVPVAILQDHFSGYEPAFGEFDQDPLKWYRQNPYTQGDRMLSGLLDVAYPGHQSWGTIVPNAPWRVNGADGTVDVDATQAAYRHALTAKNADPRIWEPIGNTRWGESLDVITDRARIDTLLRYRIVVLADSGPISADLLAGLEEFVRRGGTVVATTSQLKAGLDALTDTRISADRGTTDSVTWSDGTIIAEKSFDYSRITPGKGAEIVAATTNGDPLIIRQKVGAGAVYLTAALLDTTGQGDVLVAYQRLLDELYRSVSTVTVDGPPLQYLVNTVGTSTVVTLINTDVGGTEWHGRLHFRANAKSATAWEWTGDTRVASSLAAGGDVVVDATVPPFGVRVYAMQPGS